MDDQEIVDKYLRRFNEVVTKMLEECNELSRLIRELEEQGYCPLVGLNLEILLFKFGVKNSGDDNLKHVPDPDFDKKFLKALRIRADGRE
jgi:hypothetical protein